MMIEISFLGELSLTICH